MRTSSVMAALVLSFGLQARPLASELKIVDIRRNIPLRDDEPVYKDFYINGGSKDGLKNNLVVTAVRKTTIRDATGQQSIGELVIPVAQLRVIYLHDHVAVAREHKLLSRDDLPMLEQIGVMSGDLLDLKDSFVEKRKPSSVPPVAAVPAAIPVAAASVAAPPSAPPEKSSDAYAQPTIPADNPPVPLTSQ